MRQQQENAVFTTAHAGIGGFSVAPVSPIQSELNMAFDLVRDINHRIDSLGEKVAPARIYPPETALSGGQKMVAVEPVSELREQLQRLNSELLVAKNRMADLRDSIEL